MAEANKEQPQGQEQGQPSAADGFAQEVIQALVPYFNDLHQRVSAVEERNGTHDTIRRWNDDYSAAAEKDPKLDARLSLVAKTLADEIAAQGNEDPKEVQRQLLGAVQEAYAQGQNPIDKLNDIALQMGFEDADGNGKADIVEGKEGGGEQPPAEAETPENAGGEGGGEKDAADAPEPDPELAERGKTVGGYRGGISVASYDDLSPSERERLKRTNPKEWARLIGRKG